MSELPYEEEPRTLAECRNSPADQRTRLVAILSEASRIKAHGHQSPHIELPGARTVKFAYLELSDGAVRLSMYPGDTLTQSRVLYTRPSAIGGLRGLSKHGWHLAPDFHWGYMVKGFGRETTPIDVDEYVDLWVEQISRAHVVDRADWDGYWTWLLEHGIVTPGARTRFRKDFEDTKRESATPRPGLWLSRAWPLDEAEVLDREGRFAPLVRQYLGDALKALGEDMD